MRIYLRGSLYWLQTSVKGKVTRTSLKTGDIEEAKTRATIIERKIMEKAWATCVTESYPDVTSKEKPKEVTKEELKGSLNQIGVDIENLRSVKIDHKLWYSLNDLGVLSGADYRYLHWMASTLVKSWDKQAVKCYRGMSMPIQN